MLFYYRHISVFVFFQISVHSFLLPGMHESTSLHAGVKTLHNTVILSATSQPRRIFKLLKIAQFSNKQDCCAIHMQRICVSNGSSDAEIVNVVCKKKIDSSSKQKTIFTFLSDSLLFICFFLTYLSCCIWKNFKINWLSISLLHHHQQISRSVFQARAVGRRKSFIISRDA